MKTLRKLFGICLMLALVMFVFGASAQTDMSTTINTVSGYWTSVEVLAIGILCFVLGRRVLRKL
jgi:hypothetical protein